MHVCGILQSMWRTAGSRNLCGIYGGVSAIYIMQQYTLQKYTKFRLIHFGSVSNCRYRSIQAQVSFFQLFTIAALYKKGPGVCRGARPCAPMRHIRPMFRNPCGIYSRSSAIYAAYTAGVPQSMRHIRLGLRNLYYATIYPTEIYKVPFDTFRLSVELPIQKHTGTS